jgi:peptidoglycan/LPS O-acetylase OafA/YrhL
MSRLHFSNQLRGVAAFVVLWHHLGFQYYAGSGYAAAFVGLKAPAVTVANSPWWTDATSVVLSLGYGKQWWNLGDFGVALFFLVSGFVIPFSILRLNLSQFLVARAIRIYSVYAISVLLLVVVTVIWAKWAGEAPRSDVPISQWLAQAALVSDMFSLPLVDPVSWTLLVELKFYLLCALFATTIKGKRVGAFIFVAIAVLVVAYLYSVGGLRKVLDLVGAANLEWLIQQMCTQLAYICFLLCGYLFWLKQARAISSSRTSVCIALFFGSEVYSFYLLGVPFGSLAKLAASQALALLVFVVAFCLRERFRSNVLLDKLAAVSFPLYTTHLLAGWGTLVICDRAQLNRGVSLGLAVAVALIVAYLLHRSIERPALTFTSGLLARMKMSS